MTQAARVLHVVGSMDRGGAETMLMNLYRTLDRTRLQFDFLVFTDSSGDYDDEIGELGGRVIRAPRPSESGYLRAVLEVEKRIRANGPFIAVHSHILHASAIPLAAARRAGVPVRVAHAHNTDDQTRTGVRKLVYSLTTRWLIDRAATDLVACGDQAGLYLFGRNWRKSGMVVRNSVDLDKFTPPTADVRAAARRRFGIAEGSLVLGCIARLEPVKNHDHVLDVVSTLAGERAVTLLLAGEGSLRSQLERRARSLGIDHCVRFLGVLDDVPELLAAIDLLLLPSHHEGLPVVMIEAQAAGVPCLSSDTVTRESDLGLGLVMFLPTSDRSAWVEAVEHMSRRRVDANACRETLVHAGYDVKSAVNRIYSIYGLD